MKNLIYSVFVILLALSPMFVDAQVYVKAPNGDVGVGTDTPIQKLDVDGNLNVRGTRLNFGQDAGRG